MNNRLRKSASHLSPPGFDFLSRAWSPLLWGIPEFYFWAIGCAQDLLLYYLSLGKFQSVRV